MSYFHPLEAVGGGGGAGGVARHYFKLFKFKNLIYHVVNKSEYNEGIFRLLKSNQAMFNRGRKHSNTKSLLLKYSPVKVLVIYNSEIHIIVLAIYNSNIHILVSVIYNSKTRLHA